MATLLGVCVPTAAMAGEARIHLTAFVPTSCEMHFNPQVTPVAGATFSLGTVQQFCNVPYALTLMHAPGPVGSQLQLGGRSVMANTGTSMIETYARPVNGSAQLLAYGVDNQDAALLGSTMTFMVTPVGL
jgi:hypothetical protein